MNYKLTPHDNQPRLTWTVGEIILEAEFSGLATNIVIYITSHDSIPPGRKFHLWYSPYPDQEAGNSDNDSAGIGLNQVKANYAIRDGHPSFSLLLYNFGDGSYLNFNWFTVTATKTGEADWSSYPVGAQYSEALAPYTPPSPPPGEIGITYTGETVPGVGRTYSGP